MSRSRSTSLALVSLFCTASVSLVFAQPTVHAEIVTLADDPTLPERVLVVDLSVGVDFDDYWSASGFRAEPAGGLSLRYATDPNTGNRLTVPDAHDGGRHVTFVNLPWSQFSRSRFRAISDVLHLGAYDPPEASSTAAVGLANIAYGRTLVEPIFGGYTARAAFDIPGNPEDFRLAPTDPDDNTPGPFGRVELAVASVLFSRPLTIAAWNIVGKPVNDDCADAIRIGEGTLAFSNLGATTDGGSPCGELGSDVWFLIPAHRNGSTRVTTCTPTRTFDTVLAVYSGTDCVGPLVACNDDDVSDPSCGLGGSTIRLPALRFSPTRYLIQVGGYDGEQGDAELVVSYCFGDFDGDGQVALSDLAIQLSQFGGSCEPSGCKTDMDGDGDVDLTDLAIMLNIFATICP